MELGWYAMENKLGLNEYQKVSYKAIQDHTDVKEEVMHWAIGLGEESGEALSVIKHRYYGGGFDLEDLVGELGDVLWHISALCTAFGIDLELVARYNLLKLEHRYPELQFDNKRSMDRKRVDKDFRVSNPARQEIIDQLTKQYLNKQNESEERYD